MTGKGFVRKGQKVLICLCMFLTACGKEESTQEITQKMIQENTWKNETLSGDISTSISEDFLELLKELTQKENDYVIEVLQPMECGGKVEKEELKLYASYPDVQECMKRMEDGFGGIFLLVDADNDGIKDLFAWIWDGGSAGDTGRVLLQGQSDGSYKKTDESGGVTQELSFVEYDGKNYLLETSFDYYKKCTNGFIVSCYENGVCCETAEITVNNDSYTAQIIYADSNYQKLAGKIAEMGNDGFLDEGNSYYTWLVIEGSAEKLEKAPESLRDKLGEQAYHSDFNNDNDEEWYVKKIFYPSSMASVVHLQQEIFLTAEWEKGESLLEHYGLEYEGVPLMFWVEHCDKTDKQVVCLLCYDGISRNIVYGFLIEGENAAKVMEIEYAGNQELKCTFLHD